MNVLSSRVGLCDFSTIYRSELRSHTDMEHLPFPLHETKPCRPPTPTVSPHEIMNHHVSFNETPKTNTGRLRNEDAYPECLCGTF